MSAREAILARVRDAIAPAHLDGAAEIPRAYRMHIDADIDTFLSRLHHYDARTRQVTEQELDATVRAALAERGARRLVAPDGIPDPWLEGLEALRDDPPLDPHALDQSDGLISTCAVAIAETGTIVLDGSPGQGRRAITLVPDYHLCIVLAGQVVETVPEAVARLAGQADRPLTWISGPSATSDIELKRIEGVHGPRTLEVILVSP